MQLATDQDQYDLSQPIVVSATLLDSALPVTDATVDAILGDSSAWTYTTMALVDDGSGPDATAGDGTYTGSFAATGAGGMFPVGVTATRDTGTAFDRRAGVIANVSDGTTNLTGTASDFGVDSDADGYFDLLRVSLEFDADVAGSYWFYGVLVDAVSPRESISCASRADRFRRLGSCWLRGRAVAFRLRAKPSSTTSSVSVPPCPSVTMS